MLVELALVVCRADDRLDDRRVEHAATGGDLAHGADELIAVADAVLQQVRVARGAVGEQRDRVFGIVVLREDDNAGPGVAHAHELGRLDAFVLEVRRHPDVGHHDIGPGFLGPGDQAVEILGDADHVEVGLHRQQGAHAFSHQSESSARNTVIT